MKKIIVQKSQEAPIEVLGPVSLIQLVVGALFLIPPTLGVILFTLNVLGLDGYIDSLDYLSVNWTGGDGAMSAAPIYLGLMAIAGTLMIHSACKNIISITDGSIGQIKSIEIIDKETK